MTPYRSPLVDRLAEHFGLTGASEIAPGDGVWCLTGYSAVAQQFVRISTPCRLDRLDDPKIVAALVVATTAAEIVAQYNGCMEQLTSDPGDEYARADAPKYLRVLANLLES